MCMSMMGGFCWAAIGVAAEAKRRVTVSRGRFMSVLFGLGLVVVAGMIECCCGLCFALESFPPFLIAEQLRRARNLRATGRLSSVSVALKTTPIPPSPSFSVTL